MIKTFKGSKNRIPDMKGLWLETFPEDTEFVDVFFEKFYKPSKTLLRYDGDSLVSMLYFMDVKLKYRRRIYKGAYLYGVATALTERHAGHFSALHEELVEYLKSRKYKFIVTIPATDSLFSFYRRYGYESAFRKTEYSISTLDFDEITVEEAWTRHLAEYKKSRKGALLLESREAFEESRAESRFLGFEGGYFAFCMRDGKYVMYEVCDPEGKAPSYELIHYERSGMLLDLSESFDEDFGEREHPILNFLLN
ncbi:MAG: GNAT family N-acetyltransferase [Clostridia bacterium]|nr:GNAT family N-acetyltransferase [Clostridia bacterium]